MPFDPNLPAYKSADSSAEMRGQLNSLKALIDAQQNQVTALQSQLAPLVPGLTRSADGHWSLTYVGPAQDYWTIWSRCSYSPAWSNTGELRTDEFPAPDGSIIPEGATWWQVKVCGEGSGDNLQHTPFSNLVSFGPVPA